MTTHAERTYHERLERLLHAVAAGRGTRRWRREEARALLGMADMPQAEAAEYRHARPGWDPATGSELDPPHGSAP